MSVYIYIYIKETTDMTVVVVNGSWAEKTQFSSSHSSDGAVSYRMKLLDGDGSHKWGPSAQVSDTWIPKARNEKPGPPEREQKGE